METVKEAADTERVLAHIKALLVGGKAPTMTDDLAAVPGMAEVHDYLVDVREQLTWCAKGNFSTEVRTRGKMAGMIKTLQANMKHLIWQMERVQDGNLEQRVDFMGDFSNAFNGMVTKLDEALTSLRQKEQELRIEVEKRGAALSALKKSEENFRFLAEHDPLTQLLNRRSFFAQVEVELSRATLMDTHSCIALMDVDHFKRFNDTYGHLVGDQALRHIAEVGKNALRANDCMGRYGGEEFIFLFAKSTLEQGFQAAERVRAIVEASPLRVGDRDVPITASFGIVGIPPNTDVEDILKTAIAKADAALYQAKALGRNRVCIADKEVGVDTVEGVRLV